MGATLNKPKHYKKQLIAILLILSITGVATWVTKDTHTSRQSIEDKQLPTVEGQIARISREPLTVKSQTLTVEGCEETTIEDNKAYVFYLKQDLNAKALDPLDEVNIAVYIGYQLLHQTGITTKDIGDHLIKVYIHRENTPIDLDVSQYTSIYLTQIEQSGILDVEITSPDQVNSSINYNGESEGAIDIQMQQNTTNGKM